MRLRPVCYAYALLTSDLIDKHDQNSNAMMRRWLTLSLLLIGIFLCLFYLVRLFRSGSIVIELSIYPLVAIALLYISSICLSVLLWRLLLYTQTGHTISRSAALAGTAALMIGKYIPGKVLGLVGRISSVSRKIDSKAAVSAAVIEQAYLLTSLLVLSLLALISKADNYSLSLLPAMLVLAIVYFPRTLGKQLSKLRRAKFKPYGDPLMKLTPQISLELFAYALLAAVGIIAITWFAVDLLGLDPTPRERLGLAGAYALGITAGMLVVIIPGGIGVRETSFILLAEGLIGPEQAIALAALLRLINVFADLLTGIIGVIVIRIGRE